MILDRLEYVMHALYPWANHFCHDTVLQSSFPWAPTRE